MTPDTIIQYVNTGTLVAFIAVLVLLLLAFLRGLFRGWKYGTYRLIAFGILVVVAFATLRPLANYAGSLDLSSFGIPAISFSFQTGSTTISASSSFGSAEHVVSDLVTQVLKQLNVNMDPNTLSAYALALAKSVVSLVVLLLEGVIIWLLGSLLIMLLWHIAFKHFIPKAKRKASYKKGKLISAFEDMAIGAVIIAMILFPLTSIVNSVTSNWQSATAEEKTSYKLADNKTYEAIDGAVNAYNDSIFAQTFFNWTRSGDENKTFDTALVEYFTNGVSTITNSDGTTAEVKISFLNTIGSLTDAFSIAVKGGLLSESGFNASNLTLFLTSSLAPELIRSLARCGLVTSLLPYALEIVTNLDMVASYIKTNEGLDLSGDYALTLNDLADIYEKVVESDMMSTIRNQDGGIGNTAGILTEVLKDSNKSLLDTVISSFNDTQLKVFDKLIKAALYCYCCQEAAKYPDGSDTAILVSDFFPDIGNYDTDGDGIPDKVPESFNSIDIVHEILIIYDNLVTLSSLDSRFLTAFTTGLGQEGYSPDVEVLTGAAIDNFKGVQKVLTGSDGTESKAAANSSSESSSSSDSSTSSSSSGSSSSVATGTTDCLLDSTLVNNAKGKLLKVVASTLNSSLSLSGEQAIDLTSASAELTTPTAFKAEVNSLFGVVSSLIASDNETTNELWKTFLKHISDKPGFYFAKDGTFLGAEDGMLESLALGLKNLDDSKIATAIMPKVFKSFLTGDNSPLTSLGLDLTFNFDVESLGTELSNLVSAFADCQDFVAFAQTLNGANLTGAALSSAMGTMAKYKDQMAELLSAVAVSEVFNPTTKGGDGTVTGYNSNLEAILKYVFKSANLEDKVTGLHDVLNSSKLDHSHISDEMTAFVNVFAAIADSGLLDKMDAITASNDIGALSSVSFSDIFTNVDDSLIMKSLMGDILDGYLLTDDLLGATGVDASFNNVTSWQTEGASLDALVKAAAEIGDIGNLDFANSDPDVVKEIIDCLSQSQIFDKPIVDAGGNVTGTEYLFPKYLNAKLVDKYLSDPANVDFASYLCDATSTTGNLTFNTLKEDILAISTQEGWLEESANLTNVTRYVMRIGGFNGIDEGSNLSKINVNNLEALLNSIRESKAFGRVLTYQLNKTINTQLKGALKKDGASPFENSNLSIFVYSSYADFASAENQAVIRNDNANIVKIMRAALDPQYGILNSEGQLDGTSLTDINKVSADYFLTPVLEALSTSYLFNTLPSGATSGTLTAYQGELANILLDSSIFKTAAEAKTAVLSVEKENGAALTDTSARFRKWKVEIGYIANVVNDVQAAGLDFAGLSNLNNYFTGDDENREIQRGKLAGLLKDADLSTIIRAAIPSIVDDGISSAAGSSSVLKTELINTDFLKTETNQSIRNSEYDTLSYILKDSAKIQSESGDAFNITSVDDIKNSPATQDMLHAVAKSYLFNTVKGDNEMTSLEDIINGVLLDSGLYGDKTDSAVIGKVKTTVLGVKGAGSVIDSARFTSWDQEVYALINISYSVPDGISLSDTSFDTYFSVSSSLSAAEKRAALEVKRDSFQQFLEAVNASKLGRPGLQDKIGTVLGTINIELDSSTSLDLSAANTAFDSTYESTPAYSTGTEGELRKLATIFMDSSQVASIGGIQDVSTNSYLQELLKTMAVSNVFNTKKTDSADPLVLHESTAIEDVMASVLTQSTLYGDKSLSSTKTKANLVARNVAAADDTAAGIVLRHANWSDEIEAIIALSEALNDAGIDVSTIDFSIYFSVPAENEAKRAKVETFLIKSNESKLVYPALPGYLDSQISSMSGGSGGFDLSGANFYYKNKLVQEAVTYDLGASSYGDDESKSLSYIMMYSAQLSSLDLTSIAGVDADLTTNLLASLSVSHIFNSLADSTSLAGTVFQKSLAKVLSTSDMKDIYFLASSPKDIASSASYTDVSSKALYSVKYLYPDVAAGATISDSERMVSSLNDGTNEGSLKTVILTLQANSTLLASFSGGDLSGASDSSGLNDVLSSFNSSDLLFDLVPNLIKKFLTGSSLTIDSVDLNAANPFYEYHKDTAGVISAEANYSNRYSTAEISTLSTLVFDIKNNSSSLSDFENKGLTDTVISNLRGLYKELSSSEVFHLAGASGVTDSFGITSNDMTVFEQALFMIYSVSGMASKGYDSVLDGAIGLSHASDTASLSDEKLYSKIVSFRSSTAVGYSHAGDYDGEIDALFVNDEGTGGLLHLLLQELGAVDSDTGVLTYKPNLTGFVLKDFAPAKLEVLVGALNGVDLVNDILPYLLSNFLDDTAGLGAYSALSGSYSADGFSSSALGGKLSSFVVYVPSSDASVPTLTYSKSGALVSATSASASATYLGVACTSYTFDVSDRPLEYTLTASSSSYIQATFYTSNYALGQDKYSGDNGGIKVLTAFVNDALYDSVSGEYLDLSSSATLTNFMTGSSSSAHLLSVMTYLNEVNGFYANQYGEGLTLDSAGSTFTSGNVTFSNFLKFDYSGNSVDLSRYIALTKTTSDALYSRIKTLFADTSSYGKTWLAGNLLSLASTDATIQNVSSISLSGVSLPKIHSVLETLATSSSLKSLMGSVNASSLSATSFASDFLTGFWKSLLSLENTYLTGGSYFYSLGPTGYLPTSSVPLARSSRASSVLTGFSKDVPAATKNDANNVYSSFAGVANAILNIETLLSTGAGVSSSFTLTSDEVTSVKSSLEVLSNSSALGVNGTYAAIFFNGTIYDKFINRLTNAFIHAEDAMGLIGLTAGAPDIDFTKSALGASGYIYESRSYVA